MCQPHTDMEVPSDPVRVADPPNIDENTETPAAGARALFFARCPPSVPYEELHSLFESWGPITRLNLYRRWAAAKTSKGCGIVEFESQDSASAAMAALNGRHTFDGYPGCEAPMVLEPVDPSRLTQSAASTGAKSKKAKRAPSTESNSTHHSSSSSSHKVGQQRSQHRLRSAQAHRAAGASAAAAGWQGLPCGSEGLSQAAWVRQQSAEAAAAWAADLGYPSVWAAYTPVHLLPMLGCTAPQAPTPLTAPHAQAPSYSPALSTTPAAASAAAASTAAALAAVHAVSAMNGGSSSSIAQDLLLMQAAGLSLSPLAASEALMMHSMALSQASSQLAAFSLNSPAHAQLLPLTGSSCLPGGGIGSSISSSQGPLGAQLPPLVLPEDTCWAQDTFIASLRSGSGALASPSSDGYSLWDSSAALGCLHDAIHTGSSSAGVASGAVSTHTSCPSPTGLGYLACGASGSASSTPAAFSSGASCGSRHEGTFSVTLPGCLERLLSPQQQGLGGQECGRTTHTSLEGCPAVLPAAAAPATDAVRSACGSLRDQGLAPHQHQHQPGGLRLKDQGVEVHASTPFTMEVGEGVLHVAAVTGAHISVADWPRLLLQGSDAQIKAACELLGCPAAARCMGPA